MRLNRRVPVGTHGGVRGRRAYARLLLDYRVPHSLHMQRCIPDALYPIFFWFSAFPHFGQVFLPQLLSSSFFYCIIKSLIWTLPRHPFYRLPRGLKNGPRAVRPWQPCCAFQRNSRRAGRWPGRPRWPRWRRRGSTGRWIPTGCRWQRWRSRSSAAKPGL